MVIICACGCGGKIPPKWWHKYYPPRFLKGHRQSKLKKCFVCDFCGKRFIKFKSNYYNHLKHVFCSKKCCGKFKHLFFKHTEESKNKNRESNLGRTPVNKGKTYEEQYGIEKAKKLRFEVGKGVRGKPSKRKLKKERRRCKQCNKIFYILPHQMNKKYCNGKCYFLSMCKPLSQFDKPYSSKEWKTLTRAIKSRDNHKCTVCGKKVGLVIHHKVPFRISGNNSKRNLVTLCRSCHRKEHVRLNKLGIT